MGEYSKEFIGRHNIEWDVLPKLFFKNPVGLLSELVNNGKDFISDMFIHFCGDIYSKDEFAFFPFINKHNGASIIIQLPTPEKAPLCELIGLEIYDEGVAPHFYSIELTEDGNYYLCERLSPDSHFILAEDCGDTLKEHIMTMALKLDI